jgi:hypothetical protein
MGPCRWSSTLTRCLSRSHHPRFTSDYDGALQIWYRMKLDTTEQWKIIQLVRNPSASSAGAISDPRYDLYTAPIPLPRKKIADLAKFKVCREI